MKLMDRKTVLDIKNKYPQGTKVICESMGGNELRPIPAGMTGVVQLVDDAGTIHVCWENGRILGLIPEVDHFRIVD